MPAFFDTNILVYAVSDTAKRDRAQEIIQEGGLVSVQVLNELVAVLRRKARAPWEQIDSALSVVDAVCGEAVPLTVALHRKAVALARAHLVPIYDATIITAALEAGCDTLWSEDLQAGRRFGDLTIRNPFASHAS